MVGIGGGIPSKVRLGDVVISTPVDQYQGVVQWDFGKTEIGGVFRRTGGLNGPPSALLTALTKMETRSRLNGYKIHQYLEDMGEKWPNLVPEYTRPPPQPPKDPHAVHGSPISLRTIRIMLWKVILTLFWNLLGFWMFSSKFSEPEIGETNKNPREPGDISVHYGLIASSNQVIKDAKFRDRLNESLDGNVLCIEIEAAGLMNDFPCIVIRGICDYADSEKSKDWQEYAAAVAAACAKELLQYVQPSDVDGERTALNILNRS
jgi:nucleoside phosphorylase